MKTALTLFAAAILVISPAFAQPTPAPPALTALARPTPEAVPHRAYIETVARSAYVWGWPMVNMLNRRATITQAPRPGLLNGILPVAPLSRVGMLHDYIDPAKTCVTCPNQDVVYGLGFFDLDKQPVVAQVPDFGDRFWVYALYDARTDQFGQLGKPYGSKPGFYLLVGPNWQGDVPAGITGILRASTSLANAIPRVFQNDTAEDRAAIQQVIDRIVFYPLSEFDGTMKTIAWSAAPVIPGPAAQEKGETRWVVPERFFDQLGEVLDTAVATEQEVIAPFFTWRHNGKPAGNGWNRSANNAQWGLDYFNRTGTAKSNMFDNRPNETQYFYTDLDSSGMQLQGARSYAITFAAGQEPPVNGFWSLTLYNADHLFHPNGLKRYSLGTKNQDLKRNADGSLTLYASAASPGADREGNWLPAPNGPFSLYIRAYWGQAAILDGSWQPPKVEAVP